MTTNKNIQQADTRHLLKSNFYDYGMSVISDRALPDIRDGLKPVHRAIIYEMLSSRMTSKNKPVKVAKITGAVIGNWHPHGDGAVEEALAGLAAPWKNTLPPIQIQGNKGSVFGDPAAAGRYIEARLYPAGDAYGYKLKKGIVPYIPNFDNTSMMPTILPAQLPYVLINGISDGIAVGVATALPTHNAKEVLAMTLQYLKKPKTKTSDLLTLMPGPDFPTGATIINQSELLSMYETGYGKITVRATVEYEAKEHMLHVKEIPFSFAGSMHNLVNELVQMTSETVSVNKKKIPPKVNGILSVDDYSGKNGIDIALRLRKGVDVNGTLQVLFAKTRLETTVKFNFQALNDKQLRSYSLRRYLSEYTAFQHEIVINEHKLEQAELLRQQEVLLGRLVAFSLIDEIVDVVKHSTGRATIKDVLMNGTILPNTNSAYHNMVSTFRFSESQAESISGLLLYQLNRLDEQKLQKEKQEIETRLQIVTQIIDDEKVRHKLIIKRLQKEYDTLPVMERKTRIVNDEPSRVSTLEIPTVSMYVGMDRYGYLRIESKPFENAIETTNKSRLGFFDTLGNCWNLYLDRAKETKDRGTLISQLVDTTESIVGFTPYIQESGQLLLFVYADGSMKQCDANKFMSKTRTTKINTRIKDLVLAGMYDIPPNVNTVTIQGQTITLSTIPTQSLSGTGRQLVTLNGEPLDVVFEQKANIAKQVRKPTKQNNSFDAVVIFDGSDTCTFDWSTTDGSASTGLYVTTYQELIKNELIFVHRDGTAKCVSGQQFVVKTKRSSLQANKTGVESIYIAPATSKTLLGTYEDDIEKRIDATLISTQGKLGGGIRAFYTSKHTLLNVENGDSCDLPIVSFATQPK